MAGITSVTADRYEKILRLIDEYEVHESRPDLKQQVRKHHLHYAGLHTDEEVYWILNARDKWRTNDIGDGQGGTVRLTVDLYHVRNVRFAEKGIMLVVAKLERIGKDETYIDNVFVRMRHRDLVEAVLYKKQLFPHSSTWKDMSDASEMYRVHHAYKHMADNVATSFREVLDDHNRRYKDDRE